MSRGKKAEKTKRQATPLISRQRTKTRTLMHLSLHILLHIQSLLLIVQFALTASRMPWKTSKTAAKLKNPPTLYATSTGHGYSLTFALSFSRCLLKLEMNTKTKKTYFSSCTRSMRRWGLWIRQYLFKNPTYLLASMLFNSKFRSKFSSPLFRLQI